MSVVLWDGKDKLWADNFMGSSGSDVTHIHKVVKANNGSLLGLVGESRAVLLTLKYMSSLTELPKADTFYKWLLTDRELRFCLAGIAAVPSKDDLPKHVDKLKDRGKRLKDDFIGTMLVVHPERKGYIVTVYEDGECSVVEFIIDEPVAVGSGRDFTLGAFLGGNSKGNSIEASEAIYLTSVYHKFVSPTCEYVQLGG
jgi:hypothetical protein